MLKWNKSVFMLLLIMVNSIALPAQDKNQLKNKKNKLHKEIKQMNGLLSEINRDKKGAEIPEINIKSQI